MAPDRESSPLSAPATSQDDFGAIGNGKKRKNGGPDGASGDVSFPMSSSQPELGRSFG
jgi:hypothetical protein